MKPPVPSEERDRFIAYSADSTHRAAWRGLGEQRDHAKSALCHQEHRTDRLHPNLHDLERLARRIARYWSCKSR